MRELDDPYGVTVVARFNPTRTEDLREKIKPLVGAVFEFEYAGTGGGDESYPGQQRWQNNTDSRFAYHWVPAEDLEEIYVRSRR